MKKIFFYIFSIFMFIFLILLSRGTFFNKAKPNIILISIDTLRQDHVGAYGYTRNTTPEIDKLASEGVLFANSFSSAPWTLPSHMSMFTGLPPSAHNVDIDHRSLTGRINLFTESLRESGYVTGGLYSALYLKSIFGFSRGFDNYIKMINEHSETITDNAIDWIKLNKEKNFFLFIHYFDVHWPYRPPPEIAERFGVDTSVKRWFRYGKLQFLRRFSNPGLTMNEKIKSKTVNLYDGEIFRVDKSIGRFFSYLKEQDLFDKSVIILTSDHGEEFGEHNSFGHYHQLYSELINVPLIIKFPENKYSGLIENAPVSSVDLSNTILNFAKIKIPNQFKKFGINLSDVIRKKRIKRIAYNRTILSESKKGSTLHFAVRKNGIKYITPYRFRPIVKNKKWMNVNGKLYDEINDKKNLKNIFELSEIKESVLKLFKFLKNFLSGYINENVDGLRFKFRLNKSFIGKKMYGKISFESMPDTLPFGVNFNGSDKLSGFSEGNVIGFEFLTEDITKEIVFPMSEKMLKIKKIQIVLKNNKGILVSKIVDKSKLKEREILLRVKSGKGMVSISLSGKFESGLKVNLSKKDKRKLRTLGYIN